MVLAAPRSISYISPPRPLGEWVICELIPHVDCGNILKKGGVKKLMNVNIPNLSAAAKFSVNGALGHIKNITSDLTSVSVNIPPPPPILSVPSPESLQQKRLYDVCQKQLEELQILREANDDICKSAELALSRVKEVEWQLYEIKDSHKHDTRNQILLCVFSALIGGVVTLLLQFLFSLLGI